MNAVTEQNAGAGKVLRYLLLAVLLAGIAWATLHRGEFDNAALERWVQQAGAWGPLAFMAGYAIATVLFLPGSVLTLAGGALFGPVLGTFYNLTGATLGATLAFLVARYLASNWVAQRAGGRTKQLIEGVEAEGWRFVAFVRLVPLFPFNLLNYALGLTRISLGASVLGCLAMIPGILVYVGAGAVAGDAARGEPGAGSRTALLVLGAVVTLGVTLWLGRIAREAVLPPSVSSLPPALPTPPSQPSRESPQG